MGCDQLRDRILNREQEFQSTQPEWAATNAAGVALFGTMFISIHAARVGCDRITVHNGLSSGISIHAARVGCDMTDKFLSGWGVAISIHAARVGCDVGRFRL